MLVRCIALALCCAVLCCTGLRHATRARVRVDAGVGEIEIALDQFELV